MSNNDTKVNSFNNRGIIKRAIESKKFISNDTSVHPITVLINDDFDILPKGQYTKDFISTIIENGKD